MKKTIKYIFALVIGCLIFTSCEDPYANQIVAEPGAYVQPVLQDVNFVSTLKSGVTPLTIQKANLTGTLSIMTCTSLPALVDTASSVSYKLQLSDLSNFSVYKNINSTYSGIVNQDVNVGYSEFNDSVKTYNNDAIQRTVYVRLVAYITKGGLKTALSSAISAILVTPYNYPAFPINDVATLPMNSSITIDVLNNDTDPESDGLTIASVGTPAHGTASVTSGKVLYTPTVGYSGADSFSYTVSDGNGNLSTANVDITVISVVSYTAVSPNLWYIIGLGDGNWNYSVAGIGVSMFPLSVVKGNVYNIAGDGAFTYTCYFLASKTFKLVSGKSSDMGTWNIQWGNTGSDGIDNPVYCNSGSKNFKVPADGYYTITLNSISNTLSIVAATAPANTYSTMALSGDLNGWSSTANPMSAFGTTNNHQWYATVTITSAGGIKFNNNSWANSWGDTTFPLGIGSNGGPNIPITAGTYTAIFNDIDDCYYFIKQ